MTALEALAVLGDALDHLSQWDELLAALDAEARALKIDPDPIGRHVCALDGAVRGVMRQLESRYVG